MTFWQNVEHASGFPKEFPWVSVSFLVLAGVVFFLRRAERARVRSALVLFGLSLVGLLAAGGVLSYGLSPAHWIYLSVRGVSLFMFTVAVVTVASVFFFTIALRFLRIEPPDIAKDLILALIYIAIAIALLSSSGLDLRGVVATSAVITAVIGFSLQDVLGNTIGGMILQTEQMIRMGDWIRVDDVEGRVKAIHWRQTSIETRNWETVVIPNSVLAKSKVSVLGRRTDAPQQQRQWVYFQVSLDYTPSKVIAVVEEELLGGSIPCVAATPALHCLVTDMRHGDATYAVRYWLTDLAKTDPTNSLVRTRLYTALRRAGIPLSMPSQAVVITEEKALRDRQNTEEFGQRLAALHKIELFHSLTDEERQDLAARLITAPFARGEAITRQDATGNWLYVIMEGDAEVRVAVSGVTRNVGTLHAGDYFGEMGLMTGEPRSATVVALTDVKCYRLSKETFEGILQRRPEIAEEMSATLAHRRAGLDAIREEVSDEVLRERVNRAQVDLLLRIRQFFAIGSDRDGSARLASPGNGRRTPGIN
jgi:small-conductance mechanosensitive channel/CRP-like cAMP-binding protein